MSTASAVCKHGACITGLLALRASRHSAHRSFHLGPAKQHGEARKREAWFLIKGHDEHARDGVGTLELEQETPLLVSSSTRARAPRTKTIATVSPPSKPATAEPPLRPSIVVARPPAKARLVIGDIELTHPDRPLWPGITKQDFAVYWLAVASCALPGLRRRPLSIVRCPDGVGGKQQLYQKSGHGYMPSQIREGHADGQPYLAIDDENGLVALTQISAIELHPWGSTEADPRRPDRVVFDLYLGEGVAFA